jgi:hypothetical protein
MTPEEFERLVMRDVVINKYKALRRRWRARFIRVRARYG